MYVLLPFDIKHLLTALQRHINSTETECAKQRLSLPQLSKPKRKWTCSRCGKACASISSVEVGLRIILDDFLVTLDQRHIKNSCWRTCDECVAAGSTHCDSVTKVGSCRTCEAREVFCTKHTSVIQGSKAEPWTDPAAPPPLSSSADEVYPTESQQKSPKRKLSPSFETIPEEAPKNKRQITENEDVDAYGMGRVYDPLGGQARVPPMVKEAAVSDWLQSQLRKCRFMLLNFACVEQGIRCSLNGRLSRY